MEKLINDLRKIFGSNLICILLLGSVQKGDTTPFSDTDLVVIIRILRKGQIIKVRRLLRKSERLLDLSFLCLNEIPTDPNKFKIGTHGCYQLELILKKAKCLYGKNILLKMGRPAEDIIKESLLDKIIQYTWWVRRMFVESNRERSLESNYQLNSRLIKIVRGLMYLSDVADIHMPARKMIRLFLKRYHFLVSQKERQEMLNLVNKDLISRNAANMSEEYFEIRFSIINKVHKAAIDLCYNKKLAT